MAKVKIFNKTKQLINLLLLNAEGKEENVPLVSKGCIGTKSELLTSDVSRLLNLGKIKVERSPVVEVIPETPTLATKVTKADEEDEE